MCGIAGIVSREPRPVSGLLNGLSERLAHRGPDNDGWLLKAGGEIRIGRGQVPDQPSHVGLVHRRLSILDLSERGWQPMASPDGAYWIVFNGEIYNFVELARELSDLGHRFRSRSDTEVLLAAWRQWGPESLHRLVGMFAFAMLDLEAERLVLARDQFGIKPLFFTTWRDGFAFASEIPPLLELPGISAQADKQGVYEYLRYGFTDHREGTLFSDIRQVPPASFQEIPLRDPVPSRAVRYWEPKLERPLDIPFGEASARLRELFVESVRLHLRSDVSVGVMLSGGIDSSAVLSVMRELEPTLRIDAFSYVADEPAVSEEQWVSLVARATSAEVHKVGATPHGLVSDLDALVRLQGEPFGSTSIYAGYRVTQAARQAGMGVVLDGQGADELLAGYPAYAAARLASLAKQRHPAQAARFTSMLWRRPAGPSISLRSAMFLVPPRFQNIFRSLVGRSYVPPWIRRSWVAEQGVEPKPPRTRYGRDVLRAELLDALTRLHLPSLLRYEDRCSMAHSLETRVPFLTTSIAEFVLSLPEDYLISPDGTTKAVFRAAMRGIVPDPILDRRDKIGFATPERTWLDSQAPWVEARFAEETLQSIPMLEPARVRAEWEAVRGGRKPADFRIWRCVNLVAWTEAFGVMHS